MKKTKFVVGLAVGLMCSSSYAIDSWKGKKFIYSTSPKYNLAYKIKIKDGQAIVVTNGQSEGTVKSKNGKVIINFADGAMETVSYPVKLNPLNGREEQVLTNQSVSQIILSGGKDDLRIKTKGTECSEFSHENETSEVCESFTNKLGKKFKLVLKSKLKRLKTDVSEGSSLALPLPEFNYGFVNIGTNGKTTPAQDEIAYNSNVKSILKQGKKIVATLSDDSTITYGKIGSDNGLERVIGIQKIGSVESLVVGLLAKDKKVNVSKEMLLGTYTPVNDNSVSYSFNEDGFGMFVTTGPDGEKINNPWVWKLVDGELVAKRYRGIDNGLHSTTIEEMQECIASGEQNCYVFNERSYKVLSKKGNKFVLLRKFEFKPAPDAEGNINQHVQIMKLKKKKIDK